MNKLKQLAAATLLAAIASTAHAQLTLEHCIARAHENYPLIANYSLLESTRDLNLSEIDKAWLPRIEIYGQGTIQNAVPSFPDALSDMLTQMGQDFEGLDKLQYKVGAELSQNIWDGGSTRSRRAVERAEHKQQRVQLDVELYALDERVQNLFFGILLMNEQIAQTRNTISLLDSNLEQMQAMLRNGTAMQSDVDMVEAQRLTMQQQLTQAEGALEGYRKMLEIFIGEPVAAESLTMPDGTIPAELTSDRPELRLFEARKELNESQRTAIDASLMPKIGLFAQAYYGYPGYDYFKSMRNRDLSFNVTAGVKISWNIDSFYTRRNKNRQLEVAADLIENDKDTFLFNSDMQTQSQLSDIRSLQSVAETDRHIVELRTSVRRAAESQLANGVIDATALLTKITDENQAGLTARFHQIQLLQSIYKLKYTLNR